MRVATALLTGLSALLLSICLPITPGLGVDASVPPSGQGKIFIPSIFLIFFDNVDVTGSAPGGGGSTGVGGIPVGSIGGGSTSGGGSGPGGLTAAHVAVLVSAKAEAFAKLNSSTSCKALWNQAPGASGSGLALLAGTQYVSVPEQGLCTSLLGLDPNPGAFIGAYTYPGTAQTYLCPRFGDVPSPAHGLLHEALHAGGFNHPPQSQSAKPWDQADTTAKLNAACPC